MKQTTSFFSAGRVPGVHPASDFTRPVMRLLGPMLCLLLAGPARAATNYWDANGSTPGAGATPVGTWGADNYWSTNADGTAATAAWTLGNTAVFSAGADAANLFNVTVSGVQPATGITFEEGTVSLSGGSILLSVSPFPIVANVNATINSTLTGSRALTKAGPGTLTLNGTNTYTGVTTVSEGALAMGHSSALGSGPAGATVSTGAGLAITGGIAVTKLLTVYGLGVGGAGALRNLAGSNWVAAVQLDPGVDKSGRINSDAGILQLGRVDAGNKFELYFGGDADVIISGDSPSYGLIWGGEGGGVTKDGAGTLTISGLVTSRGTVKILGGTIRMGNDYRFGNPGPVYPDLLLSGVFDLNGFHNVVNGVHGGGSIINAGTSTLVIGTNAVLGYTQVPLPYFSGVISGGTTLKKEGPRKQTLAGVNPYTGDTIINGGTLELSGGGSISNSPVILVASGANLRVPGLYAGFVLNSHQTLMGSGSVTGAVTVAAGGCVSPGASAGTLTVAVHPAQPGGLDLSAGGTNVWELAANSETGAGTNFDRLILLGSTLTLGGASTLSLRFVGTATAPDAGDPFWQELRTWLIVAATNVAGNFAVIENGSHTAGEFTTSVDANGVWLNYAPNAVFQPVPALISTISRAGAEAVTVTYTNVQYGTNYVLSYRTNLSTTNWFTVGVKRCVSMSDSQTDNTATNGQRYYRVHYVTP